MDHLADLNEVLQSGGYRLTAARRVILDTLTTSGGHLTADGLLELVQQRDPGVGRMTVYRTLDLLSELGAIRPIYQGTGAAHYILLHQGHHHHLICSGCQQIVEFDECVGTAIEEVIQQRFNFELEGHLLEFYGRCPACQ